MTPPPVDPTPPTERTDPDRLDPDGPAPDKPRPQPQPNPTHNPRSRLRRADPRPDCRWSRARALCACSDNPFRGRPGTSTDCRHPASPGASHAKAPARVCTCTGRKRSERGNMEPTPETSDALQEFAKYGDTGLLTIFHRMTVEVKRVVPTCVGLSLALVADKLTFTAVATDDPVAGRDAVQYLDGGPCAQPVEDGQTRAFHPMEVLDERAWQLFAAATSSAGVASTLSLPILAGQEVVAGVNLYASTADAFDGHHEELADICDASAASAVTNADLTFSTRQAAARAADQIRDEHAVSLAIGILVSADLLPPEDASTRLRRSAERAGISQSQAARFIAEVMRSRD